VLAEANQRRPTAAEIREILEGLGDIRRVLSEADPKLKETVYRETLDLRLV
jgi:hypothetical protein